MADIPNKPSCTLHYSADALSHKADVWHSCFSNLLCFSLPGSLLTTFLFASAFLSSRRDRESGRLWTLRC